MFLVLTYHRIVADRHAVSDFFDVTVEELEQHVKLAKRLWHRCATPGELLASQNKRDDSRSGFLITFDDGTEDHYTIVAPILERNDTRGVFFVNPGRFGKPGYLDVEQCRELQARGHAIESHSQDHKRLTRLPPGLMHRQLAESRRTLKESALCRWDFLAPPGGAVDASTAQAAHAEGYALLRTLAWGYNRTVSGLSVESITINRSTAGRWFRILVSPRCEAIKKAFYHTKEWFKQGSLGSLYFALRESNSAGRTAVSKSEAGKA